MFNYIRAKLKQLFPNRYKPKQVTYVFKASFPDLSQSKDLLERIAKRINDPSEIINWPRD